MEPGIWQQSKVLDDILANGHRYHLHQLLHLLEQLLQQNSKKSVSSRVRIRPDTSLAFPASDVRTVRQASGTDYEVVVRFMGLYGVDSPLPQYFLDDVTAEDESGRRIAKFLDIFNQRLYQLMHQAWKKQNLFTSLGQKGLYHRLVSAMTGQYWQCTHDAMAFGGSFLGQSRDVDSLEDVLRSALSLEELEIDADVVTWVAVEDGLRLDGSQALGLETCLGDALPMMGKKVAVKVGPVEQSVAQDVKPTGDMGRKMATLLRNYLPEGVDFDVAIELTPKLKQDWVLGSDQSLLAVHTQLGESTGRGLTFKLSSEQYLNSADN